MNPSFTIARIGGIRIGVNRSWLIVFALIVWTLESTVSLHRTRRNEETDEVVLRLDA